MTFVFTKRLAGIREGLLGLLLLGSHSSVCAQTYPGHWTARWIWDSGGSKPYNGFLMARRSFDLSAPAIAGTLRITASDRYLLYVNGEYLGRGPARGDPRGMPYDTYDLSARLKPGRNSLAVLARYYGTDTGYTRDVRAGLFAQLEITLGDGGKTVIGTDGAWRVRKAAGWSAEAKRINPSVGVTEVFDARADPADWTDPQFDDARWEPANMKLESFQGTVPWSYLEPRHTPMLNEVEVFPKGIVRRGEVPLKPLVDFAVPELLASEPHFPLENAQVDREADMLVADGKSARVAAGAVGGREGTSVEKRSAFVIFDFGRPIFGFPRLRFRTAPGQSLDLTYGARILGEADVRAWEQDAAGGQGGKTDFRSRLGRPDLLYLPGFRYGDRYVTREGPQTWTTSEYKLFRYLMVVFRNADSPMEVDAVSALSYEYPAKQRGAFECSDPVLTKLWQACVDTTFLHMEDALVCDAIRERRVWTGDGGHGLFGVWAGYGDTALNAWYFTQISRGQLADGMLRMFYPGRDIFVDTKPVAGTRDRPPPPMDEPLNIPQFALFYAHLLGEQFRFSGDMELVRSLYPALERLAGWCRRHSDDTGLLYGLPNWNFVDWVRTDMRGANFETNALYFRLLTEMSAFARALGREADAATWSEQAAKVRETIRNLHWNAEKGLFAAGFADGRQSEAFTETANGMALLFGVADARQSALIVDNLASQRQGLLRASPLYYNYTLEGMCHVGATSEALALMRSRYQAMMDASDVPTLWENWDVNRRQDQSGRQNVTLTSSPVHSGSVGPAWILSKFVLGVFPAEPGFRKCRIEPQPGGLSYARGVIPSPRGDIRVEWQNQGAKFRLDINLPDMLETDVFVPAPAGKSVKLTHNGVEMRTVGGGRPPTGGIASGNRAGVRVVGGTHRFEAEIVE